MQDDADIKSKAKDILSFPQPCLIATKSGEEPKDAYICTEGYANHLFYKLLLFSFYPKFFICLYRVRICT